MSLPERLYKFGKTSSKDVLERFSIERHYELNWRGIPLAEQYSPKVLWSRWVTRKEATEAEKWFRESFPKTFFVEEDYNGITECRQWESKQSYAFFSALKSKYPERTPPKGATYKIYYVMLTKK